MRGLFVSQSEVFIEITVLRARYDQTPTQHTRGIHPMLLQCRRRRANMQTALGEAPCLLGTYMYMYVI